MGASWGVSAQAARESATAGVAAARACLLAVLGSGGRGPGASVAGLCGSLLPGLQTVPPHRVLPWQRASEPSVSSPAHRDASFLRLRPPPCCSFDFHHLLRPSFNFSHIGGWGFNTWVWGPLPVQGCCWRPSVDPVARTW